MKVKLTDIRHKMNDNLACSQWKITFATDLFHMEIRANGLLIPRSPLFAIEGSLHLSSNGNLLQRQP